MLKILIVKPSSLGDIIHAYPIIALLRSKYPEVNISWLVNDSFAGIVELFPGVDQIIVFKRKRWGKIKHVGELFSFITSLSKYDFDIVIDLQGLLRSGFFAWATRAKRIIGFANAREGAKYFYNEPIPLPANLQHAVDKNLFLVRSSLEIIDEVEQLTLREIPNFRDKLNKLLADHNISDKSKLICVAPVARWESKSCAPEFFAEVIKKTLAKDENIIIWLVGTKDERSVGEKIVSLCNHDDKIINIMGDTDLGTLVEMLRRADCLLTNDSGPMHLAAVLGTPTVSVFGPTSSELTGPYGKIHTVFKGKCDMQPCFQRICPKKIQTCLQVNEDDVCAELLQKCSEKQ